MPARIVTRSGRLASVLISAALFTMDRRDYVVVNARDVTASEQTRLEHAAIFERASIGIALTRDRRFVQANPRFEAIFGWPAGELRDQPGSAVWLDDAEYAEIGKVAGPLLAAGQPFEIEREMKKQDGSLFWCRLLGQAVDPERPGEGGTIWIADDVTERHHLDAALAAARDAAEAASRAKSAFLANTSHEIRTPLNGLLGLARLALVESLPPETRRYHLEQILACAQGLEGILSDILDFSKIEAGKFTLEASVFDLRELLAAVQASYRPITDAKGLTLELEVDAGLASVVNGDPVRIRQILGNFITNAVKFTVEGGIRIVAGAGSGGRRPPGGRRQRQRRRCGAAAAPVPAVLAGRRVDDAHDRRHRPGPVDLPPAGPADGRRGRRRDRGPAAGSTFWAELPLPAAVLPGDTLDQRGQRAASGCARRASCWSRTTR